MNQDPEQTAPAQPQPFADTPTEPGGGCSRPVLIGCAVASLLVGLLLIGLLWKAGDLLPAFFRWSLEQFEQQIAGALPEDLSAAERQRLADAFDAATLAVEERRADPAALQGLQTRLLEVARSERLSRDQVLELIEALEAVAGTEPAPPPAEVAPQPPPAAAASPA